MTFSIVGRDPSATLGAAPLDASGHASFATPGLVAGTHSITASYSGDGNFILSNSATLPEVVAQAITATTLSSSKNPSSSGQSVTFTNNDSVAHTTTSTSNAWDSGEIQPGASYTLTAPSTPGTYTFHCSIHPFMTGTLLVQ